MYLFVVWTLTFSFLICNIRKGHCESAVESGIAHVLSTSVGNWHRPHLCVLWDCRCAAADAVDRAPCSPLFPLEAKDVTYTFYIFVFMMHVGPWNLEK